MRGVLRLSLLLALPAVTAASDAPPPPGAVACLGCHAPVRADAVIPSLRGRDAAEVAAMLRGFRDGTRPATLMNRLVAGFSEPEADAIAEWVVR